MFGTDATWTPVPSSDAEKNVLEKSRGITSTPEAGFIALSRVLLFFIVFGPVISGVLISIDPAFERPGQSRIEALVVWVVLWWMSILIVVPAVLTIIPTVVAAIIFWVSMSILLERKPTILYKAFRSFFIGSIVGTCASIAAWSVPVLLWAPASSNDWSFLAKHGLIPGFVLGGVLCLYFSHQSSRN